MYNTSEMARMVKMEVDKNCFPRFERYQNITTDLYTRFTRIVEAGHLTQPFPPWTEQIKHIGNRCEDLVSSPTIVVIHNEAVKLKVKDLVTSLDPYRRLKTPHSNTSCRNYGNYESGKPKGRPKPKIDLYSSEELSQDGRHLTSDTPYAIVIPIYVETNSYVNTVTNNALKRIPLDLSDIQRANICLYVVSGENDASSFEAMKRVLMDHVTEYTVFPGLGDSLAMTIQRLFETKAVRILEQMYQFAILFKPPDSSTMEFPTLSTPKMVTSTINLMFKNRALTDLVKFPIRNVEVRSPKSTAGASLANTADIFGDQNLHQPSDSASDTTSEPEEDALSVSESDLDVKYTKYACSDESKDKMELDLETDSLPVPREQNQIKHLGNFWEYLVNSPTIAVIHKKAVKLKVKDLVTSIDLYRGIKTSPSNTNSMNYGRHLTFDTPYAIVFPIYVGKQSYINTVANDALDKKLSSDLSDIQRATICLYGVSAENDAPSFEAMKPVLMDHVTEYTVFPGLGDFKAMTIQRLFETKAVRILGQMYQFAMEVPTLLTPEMVTSTINQMFKNRALTDLVAFPIRNVEVLSPKFTMRDSLANAADIFVDQTLHQPSDSDSDTTSEPEEDALSVSESDFDVKYTKYTCSDESKDKMELDLETDCLPVPHEQNLSSFKQIFTDDLYKRLVSSSTSYFCGKTQLPLLVVNSFVETFDLEQVLKDTLLEIDLPDTCSTDSDTWSCVKALKDQKTEVATRSIEVVTKLETFMDSKRQEVEKLRRINLEIFAFLRLSEVKLDVYLHPIHTVSKDLQNSLLRLRDVLGCGLIMNRLTVLVNSEISEEEQSHVKRLVWRLLGNAHFCGAVDFVERPESVDQEEVQTGLVFLADIVDCQGSSNNKHANNLKVGDIFIARKPPDKHSKGTIGLFLKSPSMQNETNEEDSLFWGTCAHCVKHATTIVSEDRIALLYPPEMHQLYTTQETGDMAIIGIPSTIVKQQCLRDENGDERESALLDNVKKQLTAVPVHMWAKGSLRKGRIVSEDVFMEKVKMSRNVKESIRSSILIEGLEGETFAEGGVSGGIVCFAMGQQLTAVSIVTGMLTIANKSLNYACSLDLKESIISLEETSGRMFELPSCYDVTSLDQDSVDQLFDGEDDVFADVHPPL